MTYYLTLGEMFMLATIFFMMWLFSILVILAYLNNRLHEIEKAAKKSKNTVNTIEGRMKRFISAEMKNLSLPGIGMGWGQALEQILGHFQGNPVSVPATRKAQPAPQEQQIPKEEITEEQLVQYKAQLEAELAEAERLLEQKQDQEEDQDK